MGSPTKETRVFLSILHGALLVFCGAGCVWSAPFSADTNDMPKTAPHHHIKPEKPQIALNILK